MNLFRRALARIPTESDWCQGHLGRTDTGEPIYYRLADRVCLVGAILWAGGGRREGDVLKRLAGTKDLADWNDTHTYADVVALLEAAAAAVAIEAGHDEARVV